MARRLLVVLICLVALPGILFGQSDTTARAGGAAQGSADTTGPGVRASFGAPPLTIRTGTVLRAQDGSRLLPAVRAVRWDSTVAASVDSARAAGALARRYLQIYGRPVPVAGDSAELAAREQANRGALGLDRRYADLTIDGEARLGIRTDRLRNERCTPDLLANPASGCRGGFKAPRIDNSFNIRTGGVIGRRVFVTVDYNTELDFGADQTVQVYYQGLEDEIVRRVEVGTVAFRPPPSRFLTAAIPSNNFGVNATFEVGPVQLQTLAATQKGSVVATRNYTIGQTTTQPQDRQIRDVDFESGRFFWVANPRRAIPGYPALDILNLDANGIAPGERPVEVRVYRHRGPQPGSNIDPNLGGIEAIAVNAEGSAGRVAQQGGKWQLLVEGTDYALDPTRLWLVLSTKLDQNDQLAVSYRTAAGTLVGTMPGASSATAGTDSLLLVYDARQDPGVGTFDHEMRQVYRVAGQDLDPASLAVTLRLDQSERPASGAPTYLALLGLAVPSAPTVIDRQNRVFPRQQDTDASQVIHESYLIFPTLQPFADPARVQPQEQNPGLYTTPTYLVRTPQGPSTKYYFRLRYNSVGAGDRSTLDLNALQIREGSEKLTLNGRDLVKGTDYAISYETGQVSFLNPDALFGTGVGQVTAQFEEKGVFAVAPTSIFGLATRYSLGDVGAINLIGMYQKETSVYSRPQLGFEAKANLVGGVNTELHFKPGLVNRILNGLVTTPAEAPSRLDLNAEIAFTRPDPNQSGAAYLEEFEADAGLQVSTRESVWGLGSKPQSGDGLADLGFATGFDSTDAVQLTWQNLVIDQHSANRDQPIQFRPQDIDTLIKIVGTQNDNFESVMYLTLHADTAGGILRGSDIRSHWSLPPRPGRPRWRSIVTPLSTLGTDLTRDEYLEFWVYQPAGTPATRAGARLVLDLGSVNEDGLALAPTGFTVNGADTTFTGRQYVGVGELDSERDRFGNYNAATDDIGIWGDRPIMTIDGQPQRISLCRQQLSRNVPIFAWGDLGSRCTVGNGILDTEDLNGDNLLNARGPNDDVFRFVVPLADDSKYFVRNGQGDVRGGQWKLYRVPLRTPDAVIGQPNLRLIQALRMTVAAPADPSGTEPLAQFALARMRFVGSSWSRRAETPIAGLTGSLGGPTGEVIATVISTENKFDLGYLSPPGVIDATQRRDVNRSDFGTQINERALRVVARDLQPGQRAEAYFRFPSGPQNLLNYRELRVWAHGGSPQASGPGADAWERRELQAFVKLGTDDQNFYLYRAYARSTTWEPEMVIDLERWRDLRAQIETRWLSGAPASGGAECGLPEATSAYVACDENYVVVVGSPGVNPPNLAAVQELAAGFVRVGGEGPLPLSEVWIDDIRLNRPVSDVGKAYSFDARLTASDVGDVVFSMVHQDGQFRQIGQTPNYRTTNGMILSTNWRLERFLPPGLGFAIPATVSYTRSTVDPQLIAGTDLRGAALPDLRRPEAWTANYQIAIRRSRPSTALLGRILLDPMNVQASYVRGQATDERSQSQSESRAFAATYNLAIQRGGFRLPLGGLARGLPGWLRNSEFGKSLSNARIMLAPTSVRLQSGVTRDASDQVAFLVPIRRPDDDQLVPVQALNYVWRNSAGLTWQPLGMLTLGGDLTSTRDLRHYPDSTALGRLVAAERKSFLGMDAGVERDRQLNTTFVLAPRVSSWLRPRFTTTSSFVLSRSLTSRPPVRVGGDTVGAFILPQTLNNGRSQELGASVDLAAAFRGLAGDSSGLARTLQRMRPFDVSRRRNRASTFDLAAFDPTLSFQLGLGGFQHFLGQFGAPALSAQETRTTTFATGADLPFGLSATVSFSMIDDDRYRPVAPGSSTFLRSVSEIREWPVGSLRFTHAFAGGPIALFAVGTTIRQREGTQTQPSPGDRPPTVNGTQTSSLTPDFQLSLRNGIGLSLSHTSTRGRTVSSGSLTHLAQTDWNGNLNYAFRLPRGISRMRKLIRSSLSVLQNHEDTCLLPQAGSECGTVTDILRQELRGSFNTDILKSLSGGLSFGYLINDARHLNRRTSQLTLSADFQLSLFAGDYR